MSQTQNQTTRSNSSSSSSKLSLDSLKESLPEISKGKTLAAAGVAAAAAAGVAAVKKFRNRSDNGKPTIFAVTPNGESWHIQAGESKKPESTYETKKEALAAARELANNNTPSRLVVHRQDGTIQDTFTYEEE